MTTKHQRKTCHLYIEGDTNKALSYICLTNCILYTFSMIYVIISTLVHLSSSRIHHMCHLQCPGQPPGACVHVFIAALTNSHTLICTYIHILSHTHTHTHILHQSHTHINTHIPLTHTQTYTHTYTNTHKHTHLLSIRVTHTATGSKPFSNLKGNANITTTLATL